jgi:hypothetical protein
LDLTRPTCDLFAVSPSESQVAEFLQWKPDNEFPNWRIFAYSGVQIHGHYDVKFSLKPFGDAVEILVICDDITDIEINSYSEDSSSSYVEVDLHFTYQCVKYYFVC